ncbi:MAG: HD domain-containing protein [Candidatus Omnitrophica bacterium]|nr:HD domain-containing protein [Candidatus Omnitrophota bacterium]
MRAALIDIGSNSVKLFIAESQGENMTILESLKSIVPIANDTFLKDRISQETINQVITILEKYRRVINDYDVNDIKVVATTAVREARNKDIFVDMINLKTGFQIDVLSVGDIIYYINAYLSREMGQTYPIHEKNLLIGELGSGSLDISVMQQGFITEQQGLPLGMLRLKQLMNKFDVSLRETFEAVTEHISNEFSYLERAIPSAAIDDVILIDENFSAYILGILSRQKENLRFNAVTFEETQKILELFVDKTPAEISRAYKIPKEFSEVIVSYAIILNIFFSFTRNKQVYIVDITLGEALLAYRLLDLELSKKYNRTNQLISFAKSICSRYRADISHARYVADMSEIIFGALREKLGLKKDTLLYLLLASYLHDIGMFIHNRAHHKHSEYIISAMNFPRLREEDVKIIACISRYHRKASPNETHLIYSSLSLENQIVVQKLSSLLRIANALDRSHKQKIEKLEVKISQKGDVALIAYVKGNFMLEQEDFMNKKTLFEEITGNKVSLSIKS